MNNDPTISKLGIVGDNILTTGTLRIRIAV